MNSLVKVFSNFKEFYSEINGATLTGAIDVVVVEQPDGSFLCSPFHVRFGKLGVLRSREKVVDIEVNGEPVDIHMKLGESGEAFFIEDITDEGDSSEELPLDLSSSSKLPSDLVNYDEQIHSNPNELQIPLVRPRRNSIDVSQESEETDKKFENQLSDYKHRRHTDNLSRPDLTAAKKEFTTQKIRQEWAEHEQEHMLNSILTENTDNEEISSSRDSHTNLSNQQCDTICDKSSNSELPAKFTKSTPSTPTMFANPENDEAETKSNKKKRRKRSVMRKKASITSSATYPQLSQYRKGSSSSNNSDLHDIETDPDLSYVSVSNNTAGSATPTGSINIEAEPPLTLKIDTAKAERKINSNKKISDIHFFSDTEITGADSSSRPGTPIKSDSELELAMSRSRGINNDADEMSTSASWKWGELPTPSPESSRVPVSDEVKEARRISVISNVFSFMKQSKDMRNETASKEGIYLSDLDTEGLDPEIEALYFPPISPLPHVDNEDHESGNGTSLPHSPSSIESPKSIDSDFEEGKQNSQRHKIEISLCGPLTAQGRTEKDFDDHIVTYSEVCQNPTLYSSPSLVVRINGNYYNWATACPIIMTSLAFRKPLSIEAIKNLERMHLPESVTTSSSMELSRQKSNSDDSSSGAGGYTSWWSWRRTAVDEKPKDNNKIGDYSSRDVGQQADTEFAQKPSPNTTLSSQKSTDEANEKLKKTLRLTSSQIESLNLKEGMNEIVFSVTTAYQGTSRCKCYLFRWKYNDKVVISDIDGTITKSDVLGHILPMVGRDWAQLGVAQLFSKVEANGYKLLYLSARAIGQSRATREYLRSIRQGDVKLPDGPLLLNPTSLISALHREVIEKKPEQFKIACLSDIQALFPQNPFYAGYGNRINDVWAYRAVGIPIMRIFTINPKGELKHELTQTFQSTYAGQSLVVNEIFPPIVHEDSDSDMDDDNNRNNDRSDASRSADEDASSDDEIR